MWKPVVGFEGRYEVSDTGEVRSLTRVITDSAGRRRTIHGRPRRFATHPSGHLLVSLARPGGGLFMAKVHRLVLEAFVGPCPPGMECLHGTGGKTDNRVSNLRWGTRRENMLDKRRDGTDHNASRTECIHGHPFSPENTRIRRNGGRTCLACERARGRRRTAARR